MTDQLGKNGASEKKIKMVSIEMVLANRGLDGHVLNKFLKPQVNKSRDLPAGHMPYDPPTRRRRK